VRIVLKNETPYNMRDLRGLLHACVKEWGKGEPLIRIKVRIFHPRIPRVSACERDESGNYILKLRAPKKLAVSAVEKLAAVSADRWCNIPAADMIDLCDSVAWIANGRRCSLKLPPWAHGKPFRFKLPPPKKPRAKGADYHQEQIDRVEVLLDKWLTKAKRAQNKVVNLKKELLYHTKQRDKKAAS
jgi:hypothetical protein